MENSFIKLFYVYEAEGLKKRCRKSNMFGFIDEDYFEIKHINKKQTECPRIDVEKHVLTKSQDLSLSNMSIMYFNNEPYCGLRAYRCNKNIDVQKIFCNLDYIQDENKKFFERWKETYDYICPEENSIASLFFSNNRISLEYRCHIDDVDLKKIISDNKDDTKKRIQSNLDDMIVSPENELMKKTCHSYFIAAVFYSKNEIMTSISSDSIIRHGVIKFPIALLSALYILEQNTGCQIVRDKNISVQNIIPECYEDDLCDCIKNMMIMISDKMKDFHHQLISVPENHDMETLKEFITLHRELSINVQNGNDNAFFSRKYYMHILDLCDEWITCVKKAEQNIIDGINTICFDKDGWHMTKT